jgi:hypothetical protein
VPEIALDLDLLDLEVGNRGLQLRVPVDQPLVLVDQAFLVKLTNTLSTAFDSPSSMVKRSRDQSQDAPSRLQLADDDAAGFVLPLPDLVEERLAADGAAVDLALGQLALDHHLRGDAGMVETRLPQHVPAPHALEAAQDVLQRVVERVAHMQASR